MEDPLPKQTPTETESSGSFHAIPNADKLVKQVPTPPPPPPQPTKEQQP
jgi:hypothetical protein